MQMKPIRHLLKNYNMVTSALSTLIIKPVNYLTGFLSLIKLTKKILSC